MANKEHLAHLLEGADRWNEWRAKLSIAPNLTGANLADAHLARADLTDANLLRAVLTRTNLAGADLTDANLAGANLASADLHRADLSGANLTDANLLLAVLTRTNLNGADLTDANLTRTNLARADLTGANLLRAVLAGAKLARADLTGANLCKANLSRTELLEVCFANADLHETVGLDSCIHHGPSTLDHRTVLRSGHLPLPFLRGCGLPDRLIDYLPAMFAVPIQRYSCFISYSTADREFAERLYADLQNKDVRCWFAAHDVKGGEKLHEQIDAAIRMYDKLLLILSPASMDSEWVKTEIAKARKRETQQGRKMLFPVRLVEFDALRDWECFDADAGKDSAREIREYFIPDFSHWKDHDAYAPAFERLLRDLKSL